jgi:hypothetical protein
MSLDKAYESITKTIDTINQNEYLTMAIIFGLIIFAAYIAPKLSSNIILLFDNPIVKLLIFVLIAYTAKKSPTIGIIMAVCLLVILNNVNQRKIEKMMGNVIGSIQREHMNVPEINRLQELELSNINELQAMGTVDSVKINPASPIQNESKPMPLQDNCDKKMKYRNEFYPQYTDMDKNEYSARYNTVADMGTDSTCVSDDSYPQVNNGGQNTYNESNAPVGLNAIDSTCGYASI